MINGSANISSISRLRVETDGDGVRTLVCLNGCPLKCKMCPNKDMLEKGSPFWYTPESLLESLKIDDVYFRASFGGITFGGGEPALESEFIARFSHLCPKEWTVYIETSLNVDQRHIDTLAEVIDHWYIDIKDVNDEIYKKYSGKSNAQVISNLKYLIGLGLKDKITVRVPHIPDFNSQEDVDKTLSFIKELGIDNIDTLNYRSTWQEGSTTMGIPAPDPPKPRWFHVLMISLSLLTIIGTWVLCLVYIPSKVLAIISAICISVIALFVLLIIYSNLSVKLFGKVSDAMVKLYGKLQDDERN